MKIGDIEYRLSDFDTQKDDILEELKNVKYNDIEDLVYRMQLLWWNYRHIKLQLYSYKKSRI